MALPPASAAMTPSAVARWSRRPASAGAFKRTMPYSCRRKSTTAAMLSYVLHAMGDDLIAVVGANVPQADEYDCCFLGLSPSVAVVTNVEWDHVDIFNDEEHVQCIFRKFVQQIKRGGHLVLCGDSAGACSLLNTMSKSENCVGSVVSDLDYHVTTYGMSSTMDWHASSITPNLQGGQRYILHHKDRPVTEISLKLPGVHNVLNSLAVVATIDKLLKDRGDVYDTVNKVKYHLSEFEGVSRRFEFIGKAKGCHIYDDYAHHPTEVRATLQAARQKFPCHPVWVVFQPHTFSRVAALKNDFVTAFSDADYVIVTEIYAAREKNEWNSDGKDLATLINGPAAEYIPKMEDVLDKLLVDILAEKNPETIVLTLGADHVNRPSAGHLREQNEIFVGQRDSYVYKNRYEELKYSNSGPPDSPESNTYVLAVPGAVQKQHPEVIKILGHWDILGCQRYAAIPKGEHLVNTIVARDREKQQNRAWTHGALALLPPPPSPSLPPPLLHSRSPALQDKPPSPSTFPFPSPRLRPPHPPTPIHLRDHSPHPPIPRHPRPHPLPQPPPRRPPRRLHLRRLPRPRRPHPPRRRVRRPPPPPRANHLPHLRQPRHLLLPLRSPLAPPPPQPLRPDPPPLPHPPLRSCPQLRPATPPRKTPVGIRRRRRPRGGPQRYFQADHVLPPCPDMLRREARRERDPRDRIAAGVSPAHFHFFQRLPRASGGHQGLVPQEVGEDRWSAAAAGSERIE
ncbi:hypothetical protein AXF42_Ash007006 [Apostasia shenzhenica]|uniref:UDP-N-acetylmuramate--L-alanine ligase n=1 Tax=Apostasia shenzhenica TaxID=1088818 RepID=A0A2I0BEU8_9ASPA|nr:hypothetical protein AXF42_Ash007006 [Apostasia shenzhenica]